MCPTLEHRSGKHPAYVQVIFHGCGTRVQRARSTGTVLQSRSLITTGSYYLIKHIKYTKTQTIIELIHIIIKLNTNAHLK